MIAGDHVHEHREFNDNDSDKSSMVKGGTLSRKIKSNGVLLKKIRSLLRFLS